MIVGIIGSYTKENEKRLPIHPKYIKQLKKYHNDIIFEFGYGKNFGVEDKEIFNEGFRLNNKQNIYKFCDVIVLAKPTISDLNEIRGNQILFGWTHHVQNKEFRELVISKNIDLLSWEYLNNGNLHLLYRNNEIAGYAGVIHLLGLLGKDGIYGDKEKVCILGYGSVAKGSIHALLNRGYIDITVYSKREDIFIDNKNPHVKYKELNQKTSDELHKYDIIVNAVLQDVTNPIILINKNDDHKLKNGCVIADISCDAGMMFYFAIPTTFENPIVNLQNNIKYYSVDHTPSYLFEAATKEISKVIIKYIPELVSGEYSETLKNTLNINIKK